MAKWRSNAENKASSVEEDAAESGNKLANGGINLQWHQRKRNKTIETRWQKHQWQW